MRLSQIISFIIRFFPYINVHIYFVYGLVPTSVEPPSILDHYVGKAQLYLSTYNNHEQVKKRKKKKHTHTHINMKTKHSLVGYAL